jgi:hypothetical protein
MPGGVKIYAHFIEDVGVGRVAESSPAIIVIPKKGSRLSPERAAWYIFQLGRWARASSQTIAGASIRPLGYGLTETKGGAFLRSWPSGPSKPTRVTSGLESDGKTHVGANGRTPGSCAALAPQRHICHVIT